MRRERKPSPLRGLLLFLLGALVGANLVYFLMSRAADTRNVPVADDGGRVEIPLPMEGATSGASPTTTMDAASVPASAPVLPNPAVVARGDAPQF